MGSLAKDRGRWVIRYFNEHGVRTKKRTKFRDNKDGHRSALHAMQQLEAEVERRRYGLQDEAVEAARKPLDTYVQGFEMHLRAGAATDDYRDRLVRRLRCMLLGLGAKRITDIKAAEVKALLVELKENGVPDRCLTREQLDQEKPFEERRRRRRKSPKTRDDYLEAVSQFCRWLVAEGALAKNPLLSIEKQVSRSNHKRTATFVRRALTVDEFDRLLLAAATRGVEGKKAENPSTSDHVLRSIAFLGETRAMAYLLAGTIGVRIKAMSALQWGDLDLRESTVKLSAHLAKNGKESLPELPDWLVGELAKWRDRVAKEFDKIPAPTDKLLVGLPAPRNLKRLLDKDLKAAGIEPENADGRIDCHALRTFAATRMFEVGVDSSIAAQNLNCSEAVMARHYKRLRKDKVRDEINKLPAPAGLKRSGAV